MSGPDPRAVRADTVVVGGGLAGLTAAIRARQSGLSVVLVEPDPLTGAGANSRISGGVFHLGWGAMDAPQKELVRRLVEETDGEVDRRLARALAANAGPAIRWLAEQGVSLGAKGDRPHDRFTCQPWLEARGDTLQPQRGAERALARLRGLAGDLGVQVIRGWAESLSGLSTGWQINCRGPAGLCAALGSEVVVATGGFQANPDLMRQIVGPHADEVFLRSTRAATGSGLRLLLSAGAVLTEPSSPVYGHLLSATAISQPDLWPQPTVDAVARRGLLIDRTGEAFRPDAETGIALVNAMVRTKDPSGYAVVFDGRTHAEASAERDATGTPTAAQTDGHLKGVAELIDRGAEILDAPTLGELAALLGVPRQTLEHSVTGWTEGPGAAAEPTHWFAMRVVPGVTTTLAGVRVDGSCRVLSAAGEPIPGLVAAGDVVGVHGGPRGGYLGGLAVALVTGYIAGQHAFVNI